MHCTQAAEAFHKTCMKLPAQRVRHLDNKTTTDSMMKYMKNKTLFDSLMATLPSPPPRACPKIKGGLKMPLPCTMGITFRSTATQKTFLHTQVRLTRHEIMDLLCVQFSLPTNRDSYTLLEKLDFSFGQKLVRRDGRVYFASDDSRRDVLCLDGRETVVMQNEFGGHVEVQNDLCCEAVCFLSLAGIHKVLMSGDTITGPAEVLKRVRNDCLTLVLGRWFEPHPLAIERDDMSRPVCPGPLHINHCLRRYATTRDSRRALFRRDGACAVDQHQLRIFGRTRQDQRACIDSERRAYYCIVFPDNITGTACMCPLFLPNTCIPDHTRWLQTVTLV